MAESSFSIARFAGQFVAYALFAVLVGYFATAPAYSPRASDDAVVTLSFAHSGKRVAECRERSAEELAKLPPNMRNPLDCSRERSPLVVRFTVDGEIRYDRTLQPTGFSSDGNAYVYDKILLPPGRHTVELYLNDDIHRPGGVYEHSAEVDLEPHQILVIDFYPNRGFVLH